MEAELLEPIKRTESVLIITKRATPKPGIAYDTYWRFAAERQNIFFKRVHHQELPWTRDKILSEFKFTKNLVACPR